MISRGVSLRDLYGFAAVDQREVRVDRAAVVSTRAVAGMATDPMRLPRRWRACSDSPLNLMAAPSRVKRRPGRYVRC